MKATYLTKGPEQETHVYLYIFISISSIRFEGGKKKQGKQVNFNNYLVSLHFLKLMHTKYKMNILASTL